MYTTVQLQPCVGPTDRRGESHTHTHTHIDGQTDQRSVTRMKIRKRLKDYGDNERTRKNGGKGGGGGIEWSRLAALSNQS